MKKYKATILLAGGGLIILILYLGYLMSDDRYYAKLINKEKLNTPYDVFNWTTNYFGRIGRMRPHTNASPRHLIETHKTLWCDEGAIIMATLDHKLGYKTRLVDLYGYDNISHHTILQVYEGNHWINYDFTFKLYDQSLITNSDSLKRKLKTAKAKAYPKLYNYVVNNNYFAQKIIFKIRGISAIEPNGKN